MDDFLVLELPPRVDVVSDGAAEKKVVLQNDAEPRSKGLQVKRVNVGTVDLNGALVRLQESQETEDGRRLAAARAPVRPTTPNFSVWPRLNVRFLMMTSNYGR
jgi:hypothetical protein